MRMPRLSHAQLSNWAPCPFNGCGMVLRSPNALLKSGLSSCFWGGAGIGGNLWYWGIKGWDLQVTWDAGL